MQREIPEAVNIEAAKVAKANNAITILDIGGADSPLSDDLLKLLDYVSPNQTELQRLAAAIPGGPEANMTEEEKKMIRNLSANDPNRIGFTLLNIMR